MIPATTIVVELAGELCGRPLYDGWRRCNRRPGHEGPHEAWEEHARFSALAFRWFDCPRCGRSCSVAALKLWGGCMVECVER